MNFKEWVDKTRPKDVPISLFCQRIGKQIGKSGRHVLRYYTGERKPKDIGRMALRKISKGKITMESWFEDLK